MTYFPHTARGSFVDMEGCTLCKGEILEDVKLTSRIILIASVGCLSHLSTHVLT